MHSEFISECIFYFGAYIHLPLPLFF